MEAEGVSAREHSALELLQGCQLVGSVVGMNGSRVWRVMKSLGSGHCSMEYDAPSDGGDA